MSHRDNQAARDDLLTPAQASKLSGLTPGWLAQMADRKRLSEIKPGGTHRRYLRAEIDALSKPLNAPKDAK